MKRKIYLLTRKLMFLMVGITISQVLQAQVVQVPANCNVVSAGSGAGTVLGLGGKVGNGGIVVMRDPYPGGTFSVTPIGTTIVKWQLKGDLIFTGNNDFIVTTGSLSEGIKSYNRTQRIPEGASPSNILWARSKGRVKIEYVTGQCNGIIEFDIYKTYPANLGQVYVPPIVGPDCWKPGELVTYSVDPIASDNMQDMIGVDQYYWRVISGNTSVPLYYTSGDRSSITFVVPNDVSCDWEIQCWYGRANVWDAGIAMLPTLLSHPTWVKKTGRVTPSAPTFSTAPPTCLPTGTTAFSASIQPQCATLDYSWSCPYNPGVTVTASGPQGEHVTVSGLDDNPLLLTVTITDDQGACDAKTFNYHIDRTLVAPMVLLTTPTDLCLAPGDPFTLTLPANAMNNPTTWVFPAGWSSPTLNNALGSSATFTVPTNALGGSYQIGATTSQCPSTPIDANVCVLPSGLQISGSDCITYDNTGALTYSVTAPGPGSFDFNWTLPPGWTASPPVNTGNTSTITVTPNGTSVCSLSVEVCCAGTQCCMTTTKDLYFNPVTPTIVPSVTCYQAGVSAQAEFHIQTPLPGTYVWTVDPQFGTIVQSQTLSTLDACGNDIIDYSITVQYHLAQTVTNTSTGSTASFNTLNLQNAVSVFHQTLCGNSASDDQAVQIGSGYSLEVENILTPSPYSMLTISPMPPPSSFQWIQNCNTTSPSPCTSCGSVFVSNPMTNPGTGHYGVRIVAAGCTTVLCLPTDNRYRLAGGNQAAGDNTPEAAEPHEILLSPNPNGGEFELHVPKVKEKGSMIVYNSVGTRLFQAPLKSGTNTFSNTALPGGIYILHLTIDGKTTVKKMEVIN